MEHHFTLSFPSSNILQLVSVLWLLHTKNILIFNCYFKLRLGCSKAFPGQSRDVISGPAPHPSWLCQERLPSGILSTFTSTDYFPRRSSESIPNRSQMTELFHPFWPLVCVILPVQSCPLLHCCVEIFCS